MASGNTLITILPYNNEPPQSNFATFDIRNEHPILDFDADVDEIAVFTSICPRVYSAGGITVYVHFSMSSAESGNVVWQVAFERMGDGQVDLDVDSFASAQSTGAVSVPVTSGYPKICSIAFTNGAQIDYLAVGESFRIKINRDADNASDTAAGDAELIAIELKET